MKKLILVTVCLAGLLAGRYVNAQVGINSDGSAPDPSAMLEVKSANKGFLPPRVALEATSLADPVNEPTPGLMVYNTATAGIAPHNVRPGYYCWEGNQWVPVTVVKGLNPGDMLYWNGNQYINLPVGSPGQMLGLSPDSIPIWINWSGSNIPTVVTATATEIFQTTFTSGGNVVSDGGSLVTDRGLCYSTLANPTITSNRISAGIGTGQFTIQVTGLTANTLYYTRAYAINAYDTVYGDQLTARTLPLMAPTVITSGVSNVSQNGANCGGTVVHDGGAVVYFRGVCWDTIPMPTIDDPKTVDGSGLGNFTSILSGLAVGKTYYVRAYAVNYMGAGYGNQEIFNTSCSSSLTAGVAISVSANNLCQGQVATFTAVPVNGGTSPVYEWKVNGVTQTGNGFQFSYSPANGDQVICKMTSSEPCINGNPASSNTISMVVNPVLVAGVSVSATATTVCTGTSVTFTASPVNGGSSPQYQWKVNGNPVGSNSPIFSYIPSNGDEVTCTMTSNAPCVSTPVVTSASAVMTVTSGVTVSISISASANNVCAGTSVTFTAVPVNGGTNPQYQWRKGGVAISGATNVTYSYIPASGDVITCDLTSNATCAISSQVSSNSVSMTVNPLVPVSISVSASQNNICAGTPVMFTATPTNGGTSPQYQWKKGGVAIPGATSQIYIYSPANGDQISCDLNSAVSCATGNPASSNVVPMQVNSVLPVSVSISATANNICSGTSVTFSATPINGGSSPLWQWMKNGSPVSGATTATYSYVPANGDVITCQLTSNAGCTSGNPATSNSVTMTVNPQLPVSVTISTPQTTVCSGTSALFTATPVNGGTTPVCQWKKGGVDISGATGFTYSYIPVNGDVITCELTSNATCPTGSPATSNPVAMTVNPLLPVSVSIAASANNVCAGTSVTFTSTPVNGGTTPLYQWKKGGVNISGATGSTYSYIPVNGDVITCELTSNAVCPNGNPAVSNAVTMTVNPLLTVSLTIAASANNICEGTSVQFTATPVNGGATPLFQWKKGGVGISGATSSTYNYTPANGDVITCEMNSSATCPTGNPATSNAITMAVNPLLPVSVTISTPQTTLCAGGLATFTASPVNGGPSPMYQWKKGGVNISGATGSTYNYMPVSGDVITCELTSNIICPNGNPATSNPITMTVNPLLPVSVSINASANNICAGTNVTYTATPVNGGTSPSFQWRKNGTDINGATGSTYSYIPDNGDVIGCILTSNALCPSGNPASSNTITMTVNPVLPVSVSISASANNICAATSITYTATPINGGAVPAYQWKISGNLVAGATNASYTYIPANGDVITCVLTSNAACQSGSPATSNAITMVVNPLLPVSVSISPSANNVCAGTSITFTAVPVNGGANPVYQWKKAGVNISGATISTYSYVPVNGDVITCVLTSNALCPNGNPATSNAVTMTVNPLLPVSVSIAPSANNVCAGTTVTFNATPTNGGTTPAYQWKNGGVNISGATSAIYSYVPANGDVITCQLTSNAVCPTGNPTTSNAVTMTVNPLLPVSVTIAASASNVCAGTSVIFTATPVNGGTSPVYQWKKGGSNIPGATAVTYSYAPANGDVITCQLTSNASCATGNPATSNAVTMTVNPLLPVSITVVASSNPVCLGSQVTFTALPVNGGTNAAYQWLVNGSNISGATNVTYTYSPSNNDQVACRLTSVEPCAQNNPATSPAITMTVNSVLPVSVSIAPSANPVCEGTQVTLTATPVNGGASPIYQWKVNGVNMGDNNPVFSYIPSNNDAITCTLTSSSTCASGSPATSSQVVMGVLPKLPVSASISASANPVCDQTSVTFTAIAVNGGANPVYQWKRNNLPVGDNLSTFTYFPANTDQVICVVTSSETCTSGNPATSEPIQMVVDPQNPVSVSISASATTVCEGSSVNFIATPVNGGNAPVYQWKVNEVVAGTNSPAFGYIPANNDVVTCSLTSNATCPTGNPAVSGSITMTVNPDVTVGITISPSVNPVCQGSLVTFTALPVNGGANPQYQWKVNENSITGATNAIYTYAPVNEDMVSCTLTSSNLCTVVNPVESNQVTMTVNPSNPVSVSISVSQNSICEGTSVTFTATAINGGSNPVYEWFVNGTGQGSGSTTFSFAPNNGDQVYCRLTSDLECKTGSPASSNVISMNVIQKLVVSVSVMPSQNPVCAGTLVTFTAQPVNGGTSPGYIWKVNDVQTGLNSPAFTYQPSNGDLVTCTLTSSETCVVASQATSSPVAMTVNPVMPVSVTISASENPVCSSFEVTFSASAVNPGSSPSYQWIVNGNNAGEDNSLFSYIPEDNDVVSCILTSNVVCPSGNPAISNSLTMTVNPQKPVSVTINASANNICAGTEVTFTATTTNGGQNPQYDWVINGTSVGINSAELIYTPTDNDSVVCVLMSDELCATGNPATSNQVVMEVNQPQPVSISISASKNPLCSGEQVTFTAAALNAGLSPVFQWKKNGMLVGTNTASISFVPDNNDHVTCQVTSSDECVSGNPALSNEITLTVLGHLPVSVIVTASANPSCIGAMVEFTATGINPGTNPSYQWKVNDTNIPGAISTTYSFAPVNGDQVKCTLLSDALCTTGNPATSNTETMQVFPVLAPGSISGDQTICSGSSPAPLVASTPANGFNPTFQWQKSIDNVYFVSVPGATSQNFQPGVLTQTHYFRQMQDAMGTCEGPKPTNVVVITVNNPLPVSVSITANPAGQVYMGTPVTFTANPVNGGNSPSFEWRVNDQIQTPTGNVFTYVPDDQDSVTCILTSSLDCVTGNPALSNLFITSVSTDPLVPVSVTISAVPSGAVCAGTQVTYTAIPGNGGASPVFQWKVNGNITGQNNPVLQYTPVDGDVITCTLTSSLINVTGNPATSVPVVAEVNPVLPVSVSITASSNHVCQGTSVQFIASVINGGPNPDYQWLVNGSIVPPSITDAKFGDLPSNSDSIFVHVPQPNDVVTCVVTSGVPCPGGNPATSNPIAITVDPLIPVSVIIRATQDTVCAGTSVTYQAVPTNGGTAPHYYWKVNGLNAGTNTNTFTYVPVNGDVVTCLLESDLPCTSGNPALSDPIIMVVHPQLPVSVSIIATETTVCEGTIVTFSTSVVNGGTAPLYQWKVNGNNVGLNTPTLNFIPQNNESFSCEVTSDALCAVNNPALSNAIPITVNPLLPVSVTVAASANPVCAGTQVTFTATPVNGGANPVYSWKLNGTTVGANSSQYSYTPANNDTVSCDLLSNALCATGNPAASNKVGMTVNPMLAVSVTISASANNVCAGTSVTFTANAVNAGASPVYQWTLNGGNVGTGGTSYTYVPVSGDLVRCKVTSSAACRTNNPATSGPITMIVYPNLPVSVSVAASAGTVCAGTSVTFTATPVNGGTSPVYQWKVNGVITGTNSPTLTYQPANGDVVSCTLTSNAVCPTGNPASGSAPPMTVNPVLPVSVTVNLSASTVCAGTSVTCTAVPVNGGTNPQYQWKVNGSNIPGATNVTYTFVPVNGDVVTVVLTSNANCTSGNPATSAPKTITVNPVNPVSITISASANNVCGGTPVSFTATPVNGGTSPAYQWKVNGNNASGATNVTYTYAPANNDQVTCVLTSNVSCPSGNPATSNTVTMTVTASPAASVTISASANNVCNGTSVTFTATPVNGGPSPSYQWIVNNINVGTASTSATYSYTPSNGDQVKCMMTSSLACVTSSPCTSNVVTMTVIALSPVSVTISPSPTTTICAGASVTFTATPVNGGTTPAYQWIVNSTNVSGATNVTYTYTPANGDQVKCQLTSSLACKTGSPATSAATTVTTQASQAVSVTIWATSYAVMSGTQVTYRATPVNGGTSPVYQWKVNDVVVGTNASSYTYTPANNDKIKVVMTSGLSGCLSNNPATSNQVVEVVYTTGSACTGVPTVVHGGKTYNTVQIGTQCWLRENINIGTRVNAATTQLNNGIIEKWCYDNDTMNCNIYGGLYQWTEMVQYLNGATLTTNWNPVPTGNVQGICPVGWHLPSSAEVTTLYTNQGNSLGTGVGSKIKNTGNGHWIYASSVTTTNSSGFTSLPSGYIQDGASGNLQSYSNYWTITLGSGQYYNYWGAAYTYNNTIGGQGFKRTGYSVRCLKD